MAPRGVGAAAMNRRRLLSKRHALIPLPAIDVEGLIATGVPTGPQYAAYWGRTPTEKYARFLESATVSFLGMFFSYFMSFVVGGFVATILGSLFVFWGILSPEFKAVQRNWEFLGGRELVDPWVNDSRHAGLYGSLFLGRIDDVCVVEDSLVSDKDEYDLADFMDYRMSSDDLEKLTGRPYLLRVKIGDETGRELQVHARLSEDYLDVVAGMPVAAVLLSTTTRFDQLAGITDLYVPDIGCWIGDYPYLDRAGLEQLLATDDELWETLESERDMVVDRELNRGTPTDSTVSDERFNERFNYDS